MHAPEKSGHNASHHSSSYRLRFKYTTATFLPQTQMTTARPCPPQRKKRAYNPVPGEGIHPIAKESGAGRALFCPHRGRPYGVALPRLYFIMAACVPPLMRSRSYTSPSGPFDCPVMRAIASRSVSESAKLDTRSVSERWRGWRARASDRQGRQ